MARKRYSVERIVAAVKAHENGTSIGDICCKMGILEATFIAGRRFTEDLSRTRCERWYEFRQAQAYNNLYKKLQLHS